MQLYSLTVHTTFDGKANVLYVGTDTAAALKAWKQSAEPGQTICGNVEWTRSKKIHAPEPAAKKQSPKTTKTHTP